MTDSFSRRDWIKTVGVAGAGALVPLDGLPLGAAAPAPTLASSPVPVRTIYAPGDILELYSTSDVFTPARGRSFQKFSFDFPEPGVVLGGHRFSFLIFTEENTYSLDRSRMAARVDGSSLQLTADGFIWAGGQERAPGTLTATFEMKGSTIEWEILVAMDRPIRTVTTVIRDVPRGNVAFGGAAPAEPQNPNASRDGDSLAAYTFGGGDLNGPPQSMSTPIAVLQAGDQDFVYITTLDDKVRPKRYYFQAGEKSYRVEAIYEHDAWRQDRRVSVPRWRLGRTTSFEARMQAHIQHIEKA